MTCRLGDQRPDWKAYALAELDHNAQREAETHAATCEACQEELAALRLTLDAMATLREEEIPRRIGFVSDKVFEPGLWQRAWQGMLRPSFAGAVLVAAAIVAHAFVRPVTPASLDSAVMEARVATAVNQAVEKAVAQEVDKRVEARLSASIDEAVSKAVAKAVADTEQRDATKTAQLLAAMEKRYSEAADFFGRQVTQIYALNTGVGVR
jgi:anti-sigma factor RsiW